MAPSLPPGPPYPRPLQTLGWGFRPGPFMERCQRRYGDMFTLKIASEGTWVFVTHPDAVKQVFTGDPRLLHAGEGNQVLMPLLGQNSVLLLDEDPHMRQRKLMLPPFHGERMRAYRDVMTSVTEAELERWPRGDPLELWPRMQAITLEVIVRTVFGVSEGERLDALRPALRELLEWGSDPRRHDGGGPARPVAPGAPPQLHPRRATGPTSCSSRRSASAARRRTWPSATTCSRCCSRRATRTAAA